MITSSQNPKIKRVRRLLSDRRYRHREGAFVVEGARWLAEVAAGGNPPDLILATESWLADDYNQAILARLPAPATTISDRLLAETSDTETPSGVLAVLPIFQGPIPHRSTLLLVLDRLADPGNLGTIIRTAAAAGVDGVLLGPGCVDAYNPKAVRASMGALLRLPVRSLPWVAIREEVESLAVWVAAADGSMEYSDVDWRQPAALVIGSEATGVGPEALALGHGRIAIPMARQTESLNAAAAAAAILFEARRQRGKRPASRHGG